MEPKTRATKIESLSPWLRHWTIADERLAGYRSDAYALETPEGLIVIDALPLEDHLMQELAGVVGIFLTHANHQRSAWSFRRAFDAPVWAPIDVPPLDEEPDHRFDETTKLPGGLQAHPAHAFEAARYLTYRHVLFCGDLICHEPGEAHRFPEQEGYFERAGARRDVEHLLQLPLTTLCAAHAEPVLEGCHEILRQA